MDLEGILARLGINRAEAKVFMVLLGLGSSPASRIAHKAELKRGHTYNILAALEEKGLVQEYIRNKVRHFTASPPQALLLHLDHKKEELEQTENELERALPELEKLRSPFRSQAKVRFFRGVEGIKAIYEDTLTAPDQIIHAAGDFATIFPQAKDSKAHEWIWAYADKRAERGITYRAIVNKSDLTDRAYRKRREQKRELKMLLNVNLTVEINVYGDKVAVMSTSDELTGLVVEDAAIADTCRSLHQTVWPLLPDYS